MSVKMYNEDYINETAKAIQKLTGRTEKMKVSEFADVLNTYIEPNDLTNVHKVKITITELTVTMWTQLNEISFENVITGEVYQYSASDTITIPPGLQPSQDIRRLINNTINDPVHFWTTPLPLPCPIEITFPSGIDLTYYNVLHIYGGSNGTTGGYGANIKRINVDVQTGTSDYYTRLINNEVLNWKYVYNTFDDGANQVYLNLGHKKYRYCCFEILHIRGNDSATTDSITYSGGLAFYDSDNTKFIPNNMASVSTGSVHDDLSDFLTETNTTTYEVSGNGDPSSTDTGTVKLIIDFYNTPLDINEYGKCIYYQPPNNWWTTNDVNLIFTNDKYFINTGFKQYVECNHDVTGQYFSKQLV